VDKASTRVQLPYGASSLEVDIPTANLAGVLLRQETRPLENEALAVSRALLAPTGSARLLDRLKRSDKVAVLVTDNTRACPDDRLLPILLTEIEQAVPRENIVVIVALGLHAPLDRAALVRKLGQRVVENYRVLNHDPLRTVHLGVTSRGTPVEIFAEAAEADFLISTGFVEPHFFAGFSGGRKSILPGIASRAAIAHNHSFEMLEHPAARAGNLSGNPVHEDMLEQAKIAGLDFILNVLLDRQGRIVQVVAGDPVQAHARGCRIEKKLATALIDQAADITITSNSGAPLDLDFYQTCKALDTAHRITRPGGVILVASLCNEGLGPPSFHHLQAASPDPAELLSKIRNREVEGVVWQNQLLARVLRDHPVYLVSCLAPEIVEALHLHPVVSLEAGLDEALRLCGKSARVAVIPEGPRVLAAVKDHA
jgi:lactate racemase